MPICRLGTCQYLVYSEDKAAIIDLSRDTANYGVDLKTKDSISDDDIARLIPDSLDEDRWELTPEEEQIVQDILVKHPAGGWAVLGASPIQKIKDKAKELADKAGDLGKKGLRKGLDLGKKGADKTKEGAEKGWDAAKPQIKTLFEDLARPYKNRKEIDRRTKEYMKEESTKLDALEKAMRKNSGLLKGLELSIKRGYMKPSDLEDLSTLLSKDPGLLNNLDLQDLDDPDNAPVIMIMEDFWQLFARPSEYLESASEPASVLNPKYTADVQRLGAKFASLLVAGGHPLPEKGDKEEGAPEEVGGAEADDEGDPTKGMSEDERNEYNSKHRTVNFTFTNFNQMSIFIQKLKLRKEGGAFVKGK